LERKAVDKPEFSALSARFKEIFGNEKTDKSLVLPVSGYGGHRRGDKSMNFFGKTFRETAFQSKQLERSFRSHSLKG